VNKTPSTIYGLLASAMLVPGLLITPAYADSGAVTTNVQQLPLPWPRTGAILLFDNSDGTAWNVFTAHNDPTPMHRHVLDFVGVDMLDTRLKVTGMDGTSRIVDLQRGTSFFFEKSLTHIEEPLSDAGRRMIAIDLKDAAAPSFQNTSASPSGFSMSASTKIRENDRVVMWDARWTSAEPSSESFFVHDTFMIVIDAGAIRENTPEGASRLLTLSPGEIAFFPGGQKYTLTAANGSALRAVVVEIK
jgi:hypothetical protein